MSNSTAVYIMLIRNDLLHYAGPPDRSCRILWIDSARSLAYVFELHSKLAHPTLVAYDSLVADMRAGRAELLLRDPYASSADPATLPPRYLEVRDRAWAIVHALIAHEPAIYQARQRGRLVQAQSALHGVTHPSVYRYLRRYWERGQSPNALLPDYANSGARGKTRGSSADVKRGRPRKAGSGPGLNADAQIRATFRRAVARYVATHAEFSRRGAYRQMIAEFYAAREAQEQPSFGQFSYWIDKDHLARPGGPDGAAMAS